jgi:DNA-binding transcriptional LysR family regulator
MDTLQGMRAFAHVAESESFTEAARRMQATTAQVSRAVTALEDHLHTRLMNRTTRRMALTAAGERYLQRCQQILTEIDHAEAEARKAHTHPSGVLRIHAMSSFGQHHVVPAIAHYSKLHPAVSIDLTFSQSVPDLVAEGFDVSLVLAPQMPDSDLVSRRLGSVFSVACASPDYISESGMPQTPSDLGTHTCIQLRTPVFPSDRWKFEGADGIEEVLLDPSTLRVNTAEALDAAVQSGLGIGLLPCATALAGLRAGTLVRILPTYKLQELNLYLLYSSRKHLDAKIRTWVEFLLAEMPRVLAADAELIGPSPAHVRENAGRDVVSSASGLVCSEVGLCSASTDVMNVSANRPSLSRAF